MNSGTITYDIEFVINRINPKYQTGFVYKVHSPKLLKSAVKAVPKAMNKDRQTAPIVLKIGDVRLFRYCSRYKKGFVTA